jgi:hypothetical protein
MMEFLACSEYAARHASECTFIKARLAVRAA